MGCRPHLVSGRRRIPAGVHRVNAYARVRLGVSWLAIGEPARTLDALIACAAPRSTALARPQNDIHNGSFSASEGVQGRRVQKASATSTSLPLEPRRVILGHGFSSFGAVDTHCDASERTVDGAVACFLRSRVREQKRRKRAGIGVDS
jgi:hypothetical protein